MWERLFYTPQLLGPNLYTPISKKIFPWKWLSPIFCTCPLRMFLATSLALLSFKLEALNFEFSMVEKQDNKHTKYTIVRIVWSLCFSLHPHNLDSPHSYWQQSLCSLTPPMYLYYTWMAHNLINCFTSVFHAIYVQILQFMSTYYKIFHRHIPRRKPPSSGHQALHPFLMT